MEFIEAKEEYVAALRRAQRGYKDRTFAGKNPHPAGLDELLDDNAANVVQDIGLVEIPAQRIVGTRSAGRISTFSASADPSSYLPVRFSVLSCSTTICPSAV